MQKAFFTRGVTIVHRGSLYKNTGGEKSQSTKQKLRSPCTTFGKRGVNVRTTDD